MRSVSNLHGSKLKSRNPSVTEASRSQKSSEASRVPQNKSVVSKYSIFKGICRKKLLLDEIEQHGPSIVYNFQCYTNTPSASENQPEQGPNHLPSLYSPKSAIKTKENDDVRQDSDIAALQDMRQSSNSTRQLRLRIKRFLQPSNETECYRALETFETEISQFKQKHKQHRDNIHKVFQISEADILQEGIATLASQNITKAIRKRDSNCRESLLSPSQSNLRFKLLGENIPSRQSNGKEIATDASLLMRNSCSLPKLGVISPGGGPTLPKVKSIRDRSPAGAGVETGFDNFASACSQQLPIAAGTLDKIEDAKMSSNKMDSQLNGFKSDSSLTKGAKSQEYDIVKAFRKRGKERFIDIVKRIVKKMTTLNLTMTEIASGNVFPSQPYEHEGSHMLIKHTKIGDDHTVETLLHNNKYLVYDYDSMRQTALHWAAKRGFSKILKLLLEKNADPDARDLGGRTALFLAAKGNYLNCVKLLLLYRANPMVKSDGNKIAMDYTKDENIRHILRKGYRMHVVLELCSPKRYKELWEDLDKKELMVKDNELQ